MRKKMALLLLLLESALILAAMAPDLLAIEEPIMALQVSWGDSVFVFKPGESARLDSREAICKSVARWKEQGFDIVFFRMGFWYITECEHILNKDILARTWWGDYIRSVKEFAAKDDLVAVAVEQCHKHGLKIFGYHTIYDDGSPPEVLYGGSSPYPWQSRFIAEHPDIVVRDRQGNKQYGVREMAYPIARAAKIAEFVTFIDKYNLDGAYVCLRTHSLPAKFGDQFGFNEPIVEEYKNRYGIDILAEDFDLDKWRSLRGEYLTMFLQELRQALPGQGIAVSIQGGEYIGHPYGNMIVDWRTWVEEGLLDYLVVGHGTSDALYPKDWQGYGYLTHVDAKIGAVPHKVFHDYIEQVQPDVKLLYLGDSRAEETASNTDGVMDIQLGTDMPAALRERAAVKIGDKKEEVKILVNGVADDAAYLMLDGDNRDESIWISRGLPQTVEFKWHKSITFSRITIYPGGLFYRKFPSGDCSPRDFLFETWAGKQWTPVPGANITGRFIEGQDTQTSISTHWKIETGEITTDRLRLVITKSNDTGERLSQNLPTAIPPYDRTVMIREIIFD